VKEGNGERRTISTETDMHHRLKSPSPDFNDTSSSSSSAFIQLMEEQKEGKMEGVKWRREGQNRCKI
jgi:hypothetical protein